MAEKIKKNHLTIFLLSDSFSEEQIASLQHLVAKTDIGNVYYEKKENSLPLWEKFFTGTSYPFPSMSIASIRAVLIVPVDIDTVDGQKVTKTFALCFGRGEYLLPPDSIEDRFGLRVVLNSLKEKQLRQIRKNSLGGKQTKSTEQAPSPSDISGFSFDHTTDLLVSATGKCTDKTFFEGMMTGSDGFTASVPYDISSIKGFLKKLYDKSIGKNYQTLFPWVDEIVDVKSELLSNELFQLAIQLFRAKNPAIYLAIPEDIDWTSVSTFKFGENDIGDDITSEAVFPLLPKDCNSLEKLKSEKVTALSADGSQEYRSWSLDKCFYGEIEHDGITYCVNCGKWYRIDKDFLKLVNDYYDNAPVSKLVFPEYDPTVGGEGEYNELVAKEHPQQFLLLDKKEVVYGGGHSKIELCDLLAKPNTLIHVKKYTSSSTLSHLFEQGYVSGALLSHDKDFMALSNQVISDNDGGGFLLSNENDYKIVYAILSRDGAQRPHIPFFSKLTFKSRSEDLSAMHEKVEIVAIQYAKTQNPEKSE